MKKWTVTVVETLTRSVEVETEADSPEAAKDLVRDQYLRGEIVLGADDYCCTEYNVQAEEG